MGSPLTEFPGMTADAASGSLLGGPLTEAPQEIGPQQPPAAPVTAPEPAAPAPPAQLPPRVRAPLPEQPEPPAGMSPFGEQVSRPSRLLREVPADALDRRRNDALRDFGGQVVRYVGRELVATPGEGEQRLRERLAAVLAEAGVLASGPGGRPAADPGWDALVAEGLGHAEFRGPVGYADALPGVAEPASLIPGFQIRVTATQLGYVRPEDVPAGDVLFVVARPLAHDVGGLAGDGSGRIMLARDGMLRVVRVSAPAGGRRVVYLARPDGALFPPAGGTPEAGDDRAEGLPGGWVWLDRDRGLAVPADPGLIDGLQTVLEDWVPGTDHGYAVHLPTGMIAMPGEPGGRPAHMVHQVSYGWAPRGSDLVHRTSGAVLRGPGGAVGWERPEALADLALGAMGDSQLSRDGLLTWLRERGALAGPLPGLPEGPGWQQVTDERGAPTAEWMWNTPGEAVQVLPPGLERGTASGRGMRCLLDSLRQLMQPLLPEPQRAGMTAGFLLDWLVDHLPVHMREARDARADLLTEQMVDVTAVLPVFTSMFQVRVQVFEHARPGNDPLGAETIRPSPVQGPAVDLDGNPTPVLRLYWHGHHFEPVFPAAGGQVAVLGGLGEGPPAVAAAWRAARELRLAREQVGEMLDQARGQGTLDEAAARGFGGRAAAIEGEGGRIAVNVTARASEEVIGRLRDLVGQLNALVGEVGQLAGPGQPPAAGTAAPAAPGGSAAGSALTVRQYVNQHRDALAGSTPDVAVTALEAVLAEAAGERGESQFRALRNTLVDAGLRLLPRANADTAHTSELPGIDAGQLPRVFTVADAVTGRAGPGQATTAGTLFVVRQPQASDLSVLPGQEPGTVMFAPGTHLEVVNDSVREGRRTVELRHPRAAGVATPPQATTTALAPEPGEPDAGTSSAGTSSAGTSSAGIPSRLGTPSQPQGRDVRWPVSGHPPTGTAADSPGQHAAAADASAGNEVAGTQTGGSGTEDLATEPGEDLTDPDIALTVSGQDEPVQRLSPTHRPRPGTPPAKGVSEIPADAVLLPDRVRAYLAWPGSLGQFRQQARGHELIGRDNTHLVLSAVRPAVPQGTYLIEFTIGGGAVLALPGDQHSQLWLPASALNQATVLGVYRGTMTSSERAGALGVQGRSLGDLAEGRLLAWPRFPEGATVTQPNRSSGTASPCHGGPLSSGR